MDKTQVSLTITHMQVPFIVQDLLSGKDDLDDAHYALSALLSDLEPAQALLSIVLATRAIIEPYRTASPTLMAMDSECSRIFNDFSVAVQAQQIDTLDDFNALADDFAYIEELLDLATQFLAAKDPVGVSLCRLLKASGQTHKLLVETIAHELDKQNETKISSGDVPSGNKLEAIYSAPQNVVPTLSAMPTLIRDNVIAFADYVS